MIVTQTFIKFKMEFKKNSGHPTLAPFAKNRARALSRVSQLDVSLTSDKISQNLVKTRADYLRQIYIPWDAEEFSEGNFFDKFLCVLISPLYFCMNITCPVVGDDPKESWNYYLSILQELLEIINTLKPITTIEEKIDENFFEILAFL